MSMTKSKKDIPDTFNNGPTVCPHCNRPIDRTYTKDKVNYCGHCGGPISIEAKSKVLMNACFAARDFPGAVLIINDDIRDLFNRFAEKSGCKKLQDPKDVLPILFDKYKLEGVSPEQQVKEKSDPSSATSGSYLSQIVKELREINMKLGGSLPSPDLNNKEQENQVTQKRGRGRPKKNTEK